MAEKLGEDQLRAILAAEVRAAIGSKESGEEDQLSQQRRKAMEYYLGEPFGNEIEGESQVVITDVADIIESDLPGLLDPFFAGEFIGEYQPVGPEDEEAAKQATDYINHVVLRQDNNAFTLFYDWFKSAELQKVGIVKCHWVENERDEKRAHTGLTEDQLMVIASDPELEVTGYTETPGQDGTVTYDLNTVRKRKRGRVKIAPVPPEEFLISRRSATLEDANFRAHRTEMPAGELIGMGYPEDVVMKAASASGDSFQWSGEKTARFGDGDELPSDPAQIDPALRPVEVLDAYMKVDCDGDGRPELRHIVALGPQYAVVENDEAVDDPFCTLCPVPIPHRFFGLSRADQAMDLQLIKSTVARQLLNNMYNVNNARTAINERVDVDDMLTRRVAGIVRVTGQEAVGDAIHEMATVPIVQHALPVLEYLETVKETRTGITRYNQGMDTDSLNKTAHGVERIMGASERRQQLTARIFAETGVTTLFRKVLRLTVEHQDQERTVRLRNQWVKFDPRSWNAEMDVRINVGLGYGTKQQKAMLAQQLIEVQAGIVEQQGGVDGPLIRAKHIYNTVMDLAEAAGRTIPGRYIDDPEDPEVQQRMAENPPQKPQDPKLVEAENKAALANREFDHKAQMDSADKQNEGTKIQAEAWLKDRDAQRKHDLDMASLGNDLQLGRFRIEQETGVKREAAQADQSIKSESHNFDMRQKRVAAGEEVPVDDDTFKAMLDAMGQQTQALMAAVQAIAEGQQQMIAVLSAPKELVKDARGNIVGARIANGTMH